MLRSFLKNLALDKTIYRLMFITAIMMLLVQDWLRASYEMARSLAATLNQNVLAVFLIEVEA